MFEIEPPIARAARHLAVEALRIAAGGGKVYQLVYRAQDLLHLVAEAPADADLAVQQGLTEWRTELDLKSPHWEYWAMHDELLQYALRLVAADLAHQPHLASRASSDLFRSMHELRALLRAQKT